MDNQHKKIVGYRDLSQEEIDLMNAIKEKGNELGDLIARVEAMHIGEQRVLDTTLLTETEVDERITKLTSLNEARRWLAIGKTDLQKGIMAVIRSVARPGSF